MRLRRGKETLHRMYQNRVQVKRLLAPVAIRRTTREKGRGTPRLTCPSLQAREKGGHEGCHARADWALRGGERDAGRQELNLCTGKWYSWSLYTSFVRNKGKRRHDVDEVVLKEEPRQKKEEGGEKESGEGKVGTLRRLSARSRKKRKDVELVLGGRGKKKKTGPRIATRHSARKKGARPPFFWLDRGKKKKKKTPNLSGGREGEKKREKKGER